MKYGLKNKGIRWRSTIGSGLIVVALFLLFVFAVKWFRAEPVVEESEVGSIVNVLTPDPISQAIINGAMDTEAKEANLRWVATGEELGEARRGQKDDEYYIEIKTLLPEIDREIHYYQAWIIRKIPYDFFSLGPMITNDDGEFVIDWVAPDKEDYSAYTDIVITVNLFDGSPDPGAHLVEGVFGE
ncbi:MAG: hypothetical protein HQ488_00715 [Parcubacteria group bacterium]|nr:hypothetical protein [Parcubacteria group bacterium]